MKRPSSSDSLPAAAGGGPGMVAICPSAPEDKGVFRRVGSFQSMLDGLVEEEEDEMMMMGEDTTAVGFSMSSVEKKRRLSVDQVKALEKNFEVENKLEPERKVKLAQELGLQPRQVAVWFQNRRARWKTKQLERDYGVLKANFDTLKLNYDSLIQDKEGLLAEIKELKSKLAGDVESSYCSIKEEPVVVKEVEEIKIKKENKTGSHQQELVEEEEDEEEQPPALIYKDGLSDSDSSAILNDFSSPSGLASHPTQFQEDDNQQQLLFMGFNCTSSAPPFQYQEGRTGKFGYYYLQQQQHQQQMMMMKVEDNGFDEEPCSTSFFFDEQPPSLSWYCSDG